MTTHTYDELIAMLPALGKEVAQYMGTGWRVRPGQTPGAHLINVDGPDDQGVYLRVEHNSKGAIQVTGTYPDSEHRTYGVERVKINVNVSRGAATMAAEIKRRLFPQYLAELENWKAQVKRAEESANRRRDIADTVAATFPTLKRSKDGFEFYLMTESGAPSVDVVVREGGSLELKHVCGDAEYVMPMLAALIGAISKTEDK